MRLITLLLLCSTACIAQQKTINNIAGSCSAKTLKQNLYYLANAKLQGRAMGSPGDTLAANYVAASFRESGLIAPYNKQRSYFQSITAVLKQDEAVFTINNKRFDIFDGWQLYPSLPVDLKKMHVILANHEDGDSFYRDLPQMEVREKAVVLNNVFTAKLMRHGIDSLEQVLRKRGALAIIWSGSYIPKLLDRQKARRFIPHYVQPHSENVGEITPLPEIALSPERLKDILALDNLVANPDGVLIGPAAKSYIELKAIVSVGLYRKFRETHAPNVIGIIKGTDTTLASVVISAHHDHDGANGKEIYYGAIDNASGTVAIMEIAAMMKRAAKQGFKPKRTIVFASFTGEERGLLGSAWYVGHPVYSMTKTYAVLNIDMMGRPDTIHLNHHMPDSANYAYILVKDTLNRGLREALYQANEASTKLTLDTHYEGPKYVMRRLTGSDQYYFYLQGVPFIRIDCGFSADYHKPTDTPDKVNYDLLAKQTRLAFMTLWNIANKE